MSYLAFGVADVGVFGELLTGFWKLVSSWGAQPGTWLIAGGLSIAIGAVIKSPKVLEAEGDDKPDVAHPGFQIALRLISNFPRMMLALMALGALVFGILDLTGTVPLREKRADAKIEAKAPVKQNLTSPRRDLPGARGIEGG